ncbi:MAG: ABC transporter permease [Bacteroidia bacterium]|nr:ABC transporter permease [Bacteroidia bacterium]MCX7652131.1 ABC transporter permease [Bacteroidia bacterium]MDW8416920.1 ABC transporter permease [Bacteroidia bacterium]
MTAYLLRRLLFFIPTLFIITLLSFLISQSAPGDPVEQMLVGKVGGGGEQMAERQATLQAYLEKRRELGLDLPIFYFAIAPLAEPDTLHHIPQVQVQDALRRLVYKFGNWDAVQEAYHAYLRLDSAFYATAGDTTWGEKRTEARALLALLPQEKDYEELKYRLRQLEGLLIPVLRPYYSAYLQAVDALPQKSQTWKVYVPTIHWYGTHNQYHRWLVGLLRGDFGISYQDKRPIAQKLGEAVRWSLVINIISIVLAYVIAIPLGVTSAVHRGTFRDRSISLALFMLYSLPSFWVGTMSIVFLCGGDYLSIFPPGGVQSTEHSAEWPLTERVLDWAYHLILPVIVYTYGSLAFLSRQMRTALLETLQQDYIRTARAKGLPHFLVVWKHAFRNSLIPIITLLASVFPAMISGSVILETIFSIPGMGFLSYGAMVARDYPVIIAVFTIGAILTLVGILVADILYAVVDPRISYTKR